MLAPLLPAGIILAESREDSEEPLFPDERSAVAGAVEKRRREFATGRACARRALASLGFPPVSVPVGKDRAPVWPAAVVGSITHCHGYCAAAVAPAALFRAIGIDVEVHRPFEEPLITTVASVAEQRHILALPHAGIHWVSVLFSAKESVFKAWYPLTEKWLDFHDVQVEIDPVAGTFRAQVLGARDNPANHRLAEFDGRFSVADLLVGTVVAVARPANPSRELSSYA